MLKQISTEVAIVDGGKRNPAAVSATTLARLYYLSFPFVLMNRFPRQLGPAKGEPFWGVGAVQGGGPDRYTNKCTDIYIYKYIL